MVKQLSNEDVHRVVEEAITKSEYSIAKIAEALNMSERTFCRRIKELVSVTPKTFISGIQMKRCAKLLLEFPDKPLREIALMCGFEEASGLSHAFKRAYGCYPTVYREQHKREH